MQETAMDGIGARLREWMRSRAFRQRLGDMCRAEGFALERDLRVRLCGDVAELFHPVGSARRTTHSERPDAGVVRSARELCAKIALARTHRELRKAIGCEGKAPPPWAMLVHPMALRLMREDRWTGSYEPYEREHGRGMGRVRDYHYVPTLQGTIEYTRIMVAPRGEPDAVETVFTFLPDGEEGQRAQLAVRGAIPQAAAMRLEGRPLADLVRFASTGRADLDDAIAALTIEAASPQEMSTVVTLSPIRWMTYAPPPSEHAGWDDATPYVA